MNENDIANIENVDNTDNESTVSADTESAAENVTEDIQGDNATTSQDTVEVVSVQPLNSYGLTQAHMHFFAFGFFVLLMFVYFICQRGSYSGRNS